MFKSKDLLFLRMWSPNTEAMPFLCKALSSQFLVSILCNRQLQEKNTENFCCMTLVYIDVYPGYSITNSLC